jgi:predicted transposase/invertase (TIGR01784 family)
MDVVKKPEAIEDESEEWVYNYYGRKRVEQFREEGRKQGREEGREQGREAEKRKNVLHLLKMRYSVKRIKTILQLSEDEILRIAKKNNVVVP